MSPYLVGPLPRVNLCFDQLSPTAKRRGGSLRRRVALPQQLQEHHRPGDRADRRLRGGDRDRQGLQCRALAQPGPLHPGAGAGLPRDRGPARPALPPLPHRRRRPDRRGQDRAADLAEPGPDRGRPPRLLARYRQPRRCRGDPALRAPDPQLRSLHQLRDTHFLRLTVDRATPAPGPASPHRTGAALVVSAYSGSPSHGT